MQLTVLATMNEHAAKSVIISYSAELLYFKE